MKAVTIPRFGEADVLTLQEIESPSPQPGQVSIDVAYAGVNYAEVFFRRGLVNVPLPFVPGIEISGYIREIGAGVTGLEVGQPVAALTVVHHGGYSEQVVVDARFVIPLENLGGPIDMATAAAVPSNVTTAYLIFSDYVSQLRAGETVLVHGAAGGVGSVIGQMARHLGAGRVIGTVGSKTKIAFAESLGFHQVVLRNEFASVLSEEIDLVIDQIGGETRQQSFDLVRPFGRLIVMGNSSQADDIGLSANMIWFTNKRVIGFNLQVFTMLQPDRVSWALREALQRVARGDIKIEVTGTFPLEQAGEAHRQIESGHSMGKLVLKTSNAS